MSDTQQTFTWKVMGESVQGATHMALDKPNQDAIRWYPENTSSLPLILAIADGHGSNKNFRSGIGADFAVKVAVEELQNFAQSTFGILNSTTIKDMYERVPQRIVQNWRGKVKAHWLAHPPIDEEWKFLNEIEQTQIREIAFKDHARPYGSTLLAALITETFLLTMQLGDGDIMLVLDDGEIEKPIPPDTRLIANETTSLCTSTAANDFRRQFRLASMQPALVLLSTDGYSNSFNTEAGFLKVGTDIWQMMRTESGIEKVKSSLKEWLQTATKAGSGDDITLGILYRHEALKKELPLDEKKDGSLPLEQGNINTKEGETLNSTTSAHSQEEHIQTATVPSVQNEGPILASAENSTGPLEQQ